MHLDFFANGIMDTYPLVISRSVMMPTVLYLHEIGEGKPEISRKKL